MKPDHFIDALDDTLVVAAIAAAEQKTSGEIRVFVASATVADPVAAAQQQFARLNMHLTAGRNGVLIFIAPKSQNFAVVGDVAVHERCGQSFWETMAAEMQSRFRAGDFTDGVVHVIRTAGDLLAAHFPPNPDDHNELPNNVERG